MKKSTRYIVSTIVRELFKNNYPAEVEEGIVKFLTDGRYTKEKEDALRNEWESIDDLKPTSKDYSDLRRIRRRLGYKMSVFENRLIFKAAAVLIPFILLAGGGVYLLKSFNKKTIAPQMAVVEYVTQRGEVEAYSLPDNSKIWVNADSKLKYYETPDNERVVELDGESTFSVMKDPSGKIFKVKVAGLTTTVLGTEFNIDAYSGSEITIITLASGSLRVETKSGAVEVLKPNEQLIYNNISSEIEIVELSQEATQGNFGWRHGRTVCDHHSIVDILKVIERKYDKSVEMDPSVEFSNKKYRIIIEENTELNDVMSMLREMVKEFDYSIEMETIKIHKPIE